MALGTSQRRVRLAADKERLRGRRACVRCRIVAARDARGVDVIAPGRIVAAVARVARRGVSLVVCRQRREVQDAARALDTLDRIRRDLGEDRRGRVPSRDVVGGRVTLEAEVANTHGA